MLLSLLCRKSALGRSAVVDSFAMQQEGSKSKKKVSDLIDAIGYLLII